MQLNGSTFIVTGAGSGLGLATATMLVGAGANVVVADADVEAGQAAAASLRGSAIFSPTDVTNEAQATDAIDLALREFRGLHGLVNCAGISPVQLLAGKGGMPDLDLFRRVIDVNLVGTFNLIRLAVARMIKSLPDDDGERGVVVNTASVTAFDGQSGQSAYASSKAGVAGMTLPLARELARFGIRVMAVAPGIFETPLLTNAPQKLRDALAKDVPFPARPGRPEEFAALVRHIIENRYLNGEVIRLDGASRLPYRI